MNFYQQEIQRIRERCYKNDMQLRNVIATRQFLDQNFEKNLDLDQLSDLRCTSKFHLLRLFKKYYGITPMQYLSDKRIAQSKAFLKMGMSVTQTCFAVGFDSPSAFSTLFRRKTGSNPAKFQKRNFHKVIDVAIADLGLVKLKK